MKKNWLLKSTTMGDYEKEQGFASYRTIIERYCGDIVLCNNIVNVDESVLYNMEDYSEERYYNENDEEISEDEYYKDDNAYSEHYEPEIYQYYLCNLSEYDRETLQSIGIILSYSDMLGCDVLCVDHWGTSWDYVLTNVPLFDTYAEGRAYEESEEQKDNEK